MNVTAFSASSSSTDEHLGLRRHLVTGANGYVGSNLVSRLLGAGAEVVAFARADEMAVRAAIDGAVTRHRWPNPNPCAPRLSVNGYSLANHDLGICEDELTRLFERPVDFWHVAATVSFASDRTKQIMDTNVEGTRRALDMFSRFAPRGSRFFLVGTAYSCGIQEGSMPEIFYGPADRSAFHNDYEFSKRCSEEIFREYLECGLVEGALLRLGQLVGDSSTGRVTAPYGVYGFLDMLEEVRQLGLTQLRVVAHPSGALHLLPIDVCVDHIVQVAARLDFWRGDPVFHVTPEKPFPLKSLAATVDAEWGIPIEFVTRDHLKSNFPSRSERLIDRGMRSLRGYILKTFDFRRDHAAALYPDCEFLGVDEAMFARMLASYARKNREFD